MKQNQIWYLVLLSSALVSSARTSVRDTDSSPHPLVSVSSGDRSTKCAAMAGQGRCSAVLVVALVVVSMAMAAQAADHVVGGAQGWTKPNGNSVSDSYLSTWAATQTFSVGDNLSKCQTCHSISPFLTGHCRSGLRVRAMQCRGGSPRKCSSLVVFVDNIEELYRVYR